MYSTEIMLRQSAALADDIRALTDPVAERAGEELSALDCAGLRRVVLVGSGDSYHAARAAELAFERVAKIPCEPLSTQQFLDYGMLTPAEDNATTLVVAISASGMSPRLVTTIEEARQRGFVTFAVTGRDGSAATTAAAHSVVAALGLSERCPGIRTFQADLLALLLTAVRLGGRRGVLAGAEESALLEEIRSAAGSVERTIDMVEGPCQELAAELTPAGKPWVPLVTAGTGPGSGTAMYAAAKVVEASGLSAYAQDLEEWWHIERFAAPSDAPLLVIAPPGLSHGRALELARGAAERGRRVVAVARHDDGPAAGSSRVIPVSGTAREEWSPLVGHVFAGFLGAHLARRTGRVPFSCGGPA